MSQTAAQTVPSPAETVPQSSPKSVNELHWSQAEGLPCYLSIETPVAGFTLKDLLSLAPQSLVRSQLPTSTSPPLRVNGELVAWCAFEVLGSRLAVRLTDLA